jgi:hypothetical protein
VLPLALQAFVGGCIAGDALSNSAGAGSSTASGISVAAAGGSAAPTRNNGHSLALLRSLLGAMEETAASEPARFADVTSAFAAIIVNVDPAAVATVANAQQRQQPSRAQPVTKCEDALFSAGLRLLLHRFSPTIGLAPPPAAAEPLPAAPVTLPAQSTSSGAAGDYGEDGEGEPAVDQPASAGVSAVSLLPMLPTSPLLQRRQRPLYTATALAASGAVVCDGDTAAVLLPLWGVRGDRTADVQAHLELIASVVLKYLDRARDPEATTKALMHVSRLLLCPFPLSARREPV